VSTRTLTAPAALAALSAAGCSYRCADDPCQWVATCPNCRRLDALVISEREGDWRDRLVAERGTPGAPITVGCRRRCCSPDELVAMLSVNPDLIEARAQAARWREFASRVTDSYRRAAAA
jgi:hypothetical protein